MPAGGPCPVRLPGARHRSSYADLFLGTCPSAGHRWHRWRASLDGSHRHPHRPAIPKSSTLVRKYERKGCLWGRHRCRLLGVRWQQTPSTPTTAPTPGSGWVLPHRRLEYRRKTHQQPQQPPPTAANRQPPQPRRRSREPLPITRSASVLPGTPALPPVRPSGPLDALAAAVGPGRPLRSVAQSL